MSNFAIAVDATATSLLVDLCIAPPSPGGDRPDSLSSLGALELSILALSAILSAPAVNSTVIGGVFSSLEGLLTHAFVTPALAIGAGFHNLFLHPVNY